MSRQKLLLLSFWTIVFALFITGAILFFNAHRESALSDKIIVQVDDQALSAGEFSRRLIRKLAPYDTTMSRDPHVVEFAKSQVLQEFILSSLENKWAKEHNIVITEEEISSEINKLKKEYPDELSFSESLNQSQIPLSDWRNGIVKRLLQKKISAELLKNLPEIPESEIESYYSNSKDLFKQKKQIKLRQIVFDNEDDANRLLHSLGKQDSFGDLAKKYSISPEAKSGGDLGWIEEGVSDIFDKAFSIKIGQRSSVLKSPYGYHILEVLDKRSERTRPLEEVREQIRLELVGNREQALYSSWLENQIQNANIKKNLTALSEIEVLNIGD